MKKYDVIIIGGGIGGLTSGIILSKEGLSVCVLEQHSVIGGCLQSFKRHGRTLDTGMHYIGSMGEGEIMHQYFKYFGITDDLRLRKLSDDGFDYFHFPSVYRDITAADVCRFLEDSITKERMSLAVIYPNKEDIA